MWFATIADTVIGGGGDDGFWSDGDAKGLLLRHFGGWHEPIASLLHATAEGGIVREDAEAMTRGGLRAAGAAAAAAASRRRPGPGDGDEGAGVVLVGDAAHTVRLGMRRDGAI